MYCMIWSDLLRETAPWRYSSLMMMKVNDSPSWAGPSPCVYVELGISSITKFVTLQDSCSALLSNQIAAFSCFVMGLYTEYVTLCSGPCQTETNH